MSRGFLHLSFSTVLSYFEVGLIKTHFLNEDEGNSKMLYILQMNVAYFYEKPPFNYICLLNRVFLINSTHIFRHVKQLAKQIMNQWWSFEPFIDETS